eukprot:g1340.t1
MIQTPSSKQNLEDQDGSFGARPALPVSDGEPDWETGSPKTAEEYLKRVRWEAAQCSQTTLAELDVSVFEEKRTEYATPQFKAVAETPLYCQATTAWIKQTLKDFHQLRTHLESLDKLGEELAIGNVVSNEAPDLIEIQLEPEALETGPTVDFIGSLEQVKTYQLLRAHISEFLKTDEISDQRCFWLYALLSRIHLPLHDTTAALMRSLFIHCSNLRSRYAADQISNEDLLDSDSTLPRLNLLLAISGVYFGQDEKLSGIIDIDNL